MPSDELESLLSAAETLQLSLFTSNGNVSIQGQQEWHQDTAGGGKAQKEDLETDTTIDRKAGTQPVASYQDCSLDKEVEIDNFFKSTGMASRTDGNEPEPEKKKSLCSECGKEFEAFNHLWVHIQSDHQHRHKCKNCGQSWRRRLELERHIKSKHFNIN